MTELMTKMALS